MSLAADLALALTLWVHPGGDVACARGAANPCWTPDLVAEAALDARARGLGAEGWICDGDLVRNTGARNGRGFDAGVMVAAFSKGWLQARGLRWRELGDGRACIPTTVYAGVHEVEACGNPVVVLRRAGGAALAAVAAPTALSHPFGPQGAPRDPYVRRDADPGMPVVSTPVGLLLMLTACVSLCLMARR